MLMSKKVLILLCTAIVLMVPLGAVHAAAPGTVTIQGTLEASGGGAVTGQRAYRVRFFDAATGGTTLAEATGTVNLSSAGRFSIALSASSSMI